MIGQRAQHGNLRVIQITKRTQFANELRVRGQCNPLSNYARFLDGFFSRTPGPHPFCSVNSTPTASSAWRTTRQRDFFSSRVGWL